MSTTQIRVSNSSKSVFSDDKENVCPLQGSVASQAHEALRLSRSPLPLGFPRAPLQDITDVLSPLNVLRDEDEPTGSGLGCRPRRKRSKCEIQCSGSMASCSKQASISCSSVPGINLQISTEEEQKITVVQEQTTADEVQEKKNTVDENHVSLVLSSEKAIEISMEGLTETQDLAKAQDLRMESSLSKRSSDHIKIDSSRSETVEMRGESSNSSKDKSLEGTTLISPNSAVSQRRRRRPVLEQKPAAPSTRLNLRSVSSKTTTRSSVMKFR